MGDRYIALIDGPPARHAQLGRMAEGERRWKVAVDQPGRIVIVEKDARVVMLGDDGIVIGPLFAVGRRSREIELSRDAQATIMSGRGKLLIGSYWGGYVGILFGRDHRTTDIVRAPFGELPCFRLPLEGGWLVASDVALLVRCGAPAPVVDWDALARFLGAPDTRRTETCLTGIAEVRGGDRLTCSGTSSETETLWSPWQYAGRSRQLRDPIEAQRRLRDTITSCVAARGSGSTINLLLSGGLDSSIVAAATAASGLAAIFTTVSTIDPSGDERRYAQVVAQRTGTDLTACTFERQFVDLQRSGAARLPRPVARAFEYEARRQGRRVAEVAGADMVFSGGGGDNVFCSLQSITPLLDCLQESDARQHFWPIAREIAELTRTSLWTVVRRTMQRHLRGPQPIPVETNTQYLSAEAAGLAMAAPSHPWLERPRDVLPGKGSHVALLLGTQGLAEDSNPQDVRPLLYPLLSQPVVELCLRIPSWQWFDRGCNRAAARHAFTSALPQEIAWRRSKGSPDSFVVELYEANRSLIRDMLLGGNLARHGLLDRQTLAQKLDEEGPPKGDDHGRVMRLVDVEAWSRCWTG